MNFKLVNHLFVLMAFGLFACGNSNDPGIKVSGKVENPQDGFVRLIKLEAGQAVDLDTLDIDGEGNFSFSLDLDQPDFYQINFYNKQVATLILHEDDIKVIADGSNPQGKLEISGSKDVAYFNALVELYKVQNEKTQILNERFLEARQTENVEAMEAIQQEYFDMQNAFKDDVKELVGNMGNSIAALQAMNFMDVEDADDFKVMMNVADRLSAAYPNSDVVKQLADQVNSLKNIAVGSVAPNFELETPEGEMMKLSDLRGQYVLVDFWAAWCRPCRAENPNIVSAYAKFKDKNFTVLGVSLDRKKEDWVKAIDADNLTWHQVSDLKYWQSDVVPLYGIKGIPFSVLLDTEGKIIAKNLRGKKLHDTLAEVLN